MGLSIVKDHQISNDRRDQARVGHERAKPGGISRAAPKKPEPATSRTALERARDSFDAGTKATPRGGR